MRKNFEKPMINCKIFKTKNKCLIFLKIIFTKCKMLKCSFLFLTTITLQHSDKLTINLLCYQPILVRDSNKRCCDFV